MIRDALICALGDTVLLALVVTAAFARELLTRGIANFLPERWCTPAYLADRSNP